MANETNKPSVYACVYIYIYQSMYIHTEYKAIQKDATTYIYTYISDP